MLLANPIYSWLVSKVKKDRIVLYTYLFFILNLLCFLLGWNFLDESGRARIAKVFYIWCNVYSFFVVSIFWVSMINFFQSHEAKKYFGIISAGGSLGAFTGSSVARYFSTEICGTASMSDWGPFSLIVVSVVALSIAVILSLGFKPKANHPSNMEEPEEILGGSWMDPFRSVFRSPSVRNLTLYMILWTSVMTIGWMVALDIIQNWSSDSCERTAFFARIEQIVTPLTLICQFFITSYILRKIGIAAVLIAYGFLLFAGLVAYATFPELTTVLVVVCILRVFEYGFNKPARETIFTVLKKQERYKSTVFMDTFFARSGEAMGSWFAVKGMLILGLSSLSAAWGALPLAVLLSWVGYQTTKSKKV
jgi:AAA family ATP:ADP antiporter